MTLSPDIRHTIASHTANMTVLERVIRVQQLCKTYRITNPDDIREARQIAAVPEEV